MILNGDTLTMLRTLPDESVHCVVTSPPYWRLRDYDVAGQIGLEKTPQEYIIRLVHVFREVRRVLRGDGTLWLNMGDSYASRAGEQGKQVQMVNRRIVHARTRLGYPGFKQKDLMGMPWTLALALREDGWWLRQEIIWNKPSPMPESVSDRCTKSHEHIFLLTKRPRYYYDADAIKEAVTGNAHSRGSGVNPKAKVPSGWDTSDGDHRGLQGRYPRAKQNESFSAQVTETVNERNMRSVWTIASAPYPDAHFATFPPELPRRCIAAGTSAHGCCPVCGAQWKRVATRGYLQQRKRAGWILRGKDARGLNRSDSMFRHGKATKTSTTMGWIRTCSHKEAPVPCVVLDNFAGSGTTLEVAMRMGRRYIGIELNPEYLPLIEKRLEKHKLPLFEN